MKMDKRDGKSVSPWESFVSEIPHETEKLRKRYDVLIVGGGITGITTALMLQSNGLNCLIAEKNVIGSGTTGGTSAHLNTYLDATYPEIEQDFSEDAAVLVSKAAKESMAIIRKNVANLHIDADLEEKKAYLFAEDEKQDKQLEEIFEASKRAKVSVSKTNGNAP